LNRNKRNTNHVVWRSALTSTALEAVRGGYIRS
jgi:hypothetical protein